MDCLSFVARDWLIYITDAGQATHFYMCFDLARKAGWVQQQRLDHIGTLTRKRYDIECVQFCISSWFCKRVYLGIADSLDMFLDLFFALSLKPLLRFSLRHWRVWNGTWVGFGVVCGEDNKRFKSRSGDTVRLVDLLDASKSRMEEQLTARAAEGKTPLEVISCYFIKLELIHVTCHSRAPILLRRPRPLATGLSSTSIWSRTQWRITCSATIACLTPGERNKRVNRVDHIVLMCYISCSMSCDLSARQWIDGTEETPRCTSYSAMLEYHPYLERWVPHLFPYRNSWRPRYVHILSAPVATEL